MRRFLFPAIAIASGLLVLLGYFFSIPVLQNIQLLFLRWAVILAGAAIFVGIINLLVVHFQKMSNKNKDGVNSLLLVVSLFITLFLGLLFGVDSPTMNHIFNAVIIPVESSLLAVMTVSLVYAAIRLFRYRQDLFSVIFLATVILVLLGTAPLPFDLLPFLGTSLRPFIVNVLAGSGARGILIGVALGTLLTGLRVMLAADRPYGGK